MSTIARTAACPALTLQGGPRAALEMRWKRSCGVPFEKDRQRHLAAQARIFNQPQWALLCAPGVGSFLEKGASVPDSVLKRLRRRSRAILSLASPVFLKPTVCWRGSFVYRISPKNHTIQGDDRYLKLLEEGNVYDLRMLRRIGSNPIEFTLALDTGEERTCPEDVLMRILAAAPRWIVEQEIRGAKFGGAACELRLIYSPGERASAVAAYGKAAGDDFRNNLSKGGVPVAALDFLRGLIPESSAPQSALEKIFERGSRLADFFYSRVPEIKPYPLALDLMPVAGRGRLDFWFLEANIGIFQYDGLREVDPRAAKRVDALF